MSLQEVQPQPLTSIDDIPTPRPNWILRYALKIQKYSAYTFSTFVGIHFTSVILTPIYPKHIAPQIFEIARAIYHGIPMFETVGIIGAGIAHVLAGITVRIVRPKRKRGPAEEDVLIGLGGITSLVGLGYRKSIISSLFPSLSPLLLLGYLLIPLLGYHFYKFRYAPMMVDGDLSLLTMEYVAMYARTLMNKTAIWGLLVTANYHFVAGWMRFQHKFSKRWRKLAYAMWFGLTALGVVSVGMQSVPSGFLERRFSEYLG